VGAVNAFGRRSSYSTPGSAIWVSAPGGEFGLSVEAGWASPPTNPEYVFEPAMVTTDQSGCDQGYSNDFDGAPYNLFEDGSEENPDCDYTSTFNGTSSATPVTAGVIALLLEANPDLTWRDVKHILASTAEKVDPDQAGVIILETSGIIDQPYQVELGWIENGAGYHFHNWYGFGRVDVTSGVAMAQSYDLDTLGIFQDSGFTGSGSLNVGIPDATPTGVESIISVTSDLTIEAVQIQVSVDHGYVGDLGIELRSPEGTRSILLNAYNGFASADLDDMVLESNAFYGESSLGNWTLKVVDAYEMVQGTLTNWRIRFYGH